MGRGRPKGTRPPAAGMGRKPGVPNKATADARRAIAAFVDNNAHKLQEWLDAIADGVRAPEEVDDEGNASPGKLLVPPNPAKAFELFQSVVEYHIPKLARTELTGEGGGPVRIQRIERVIVKPSNRNG